MERDFLYQEDSGKMTRTAFYWELWSKRRPVRHRYWGVLGWGGAVPLTWGRKAHGHTGNQNAHCSDGEIHHGSSGSGIGYPGPFILHNHWEKVHSFFVWVSHGEKVFEVYPEFGPVFPELATGSL